MKLISPPSLAVIMPEYPAPSQTFIRRDIVALRELGASVEIFSTRPPETLAPHWGPKAKSETTYLSQPSPKGMLGIVTGLTRLPLKKLVGQARSEGRTALRDLLLCIPLAGIFAAECKKRGVTHIHAHMPSRAATIASLASYMLNTPYSITIHGELRLYGPNQQINWGHAAFGIAVNSGLIDEVRQAVAPQPLCPMVTQPMGIDSQFFTRPVPYKPRNEGEKLRIFSCGRINRGKGHNIMLKALSILIKSGHDVQLEIAGAAGAGQSQYEQDLKQMVREFDLEPHVKWLGASSEEQVRDALNRSHVFALASRSEGLGMVYLEALSASVPAIGTNVGGVPEVIKDQETGLLVPPNDPIALAEALTKISSDPDLAMGLSKAGREWAISRFDIKGSAKVLLQQAYPEWSARNGI